ncbi:tetratricopeptide repeat protein [Pseudidiomarina marina]|uniref:2OG-Fe(II) oxygenase family protein n=1 Tax=Pseudidiomarina marina TaxID=502366 RepID=UPI00384B2390
MTDVQKLFQQAVNAFRAEQYSEAEHQCRHLLRFNAKHPDVLHILALSLQHQHQPKAAAENLKAALKHNPHHCPSRKSLIALYIQHGHYDAAQQEIDALIQDQPNHFEPYFLQAKLYRELGLATEAMEAIQHAKQKLQQPSPIVDYLKACIHYDLEDYERTEVILQNLVRQLPEYIDAHVALNKLYWEYGPQEKFLDSFKLALERLPQSRPLLFNLATHKLLAGKLQETLELCQSVVQKHSQWAEFHHLQGVTLARLKQPDEARGAYQKAVELNPNSIRHQLDLAVNLMRHGDYEDALQHVKAVAKMHPYNQEMLAYQALCFQALGNDKAQWLNNYEQFVKVVPLQVPQSYSSIESFMDELAETLSGMHNSTQHPLDQSVRHGTQTMGNLFANKAPIIGELKQMIEQAAHSYIDGLPDDSQHPFLQRKNKQIRFTGAWSVCLKEQGFHTNHVHPEGWLSCCTYIQLPQQITPNDSEQAGWIRFGDPGIELPGLTPVTEAKCPQVGYCVFFPSYFFHGTVPFSGHGARITAPCDISPQW